MAKKKILLSIIGSMASGKSTLNRGIKDFITDGEIPIEVKTEKMHYSVYVESGLCILGRVADNATGIGLDSVYSNLKPEGVRNSLEAALNDDRIKIIVMECAFQTLSWHRLFYKSGLRGKYTHLVVYLHFDVWNNFKRLSERKAKKHNEKNPEDLKEWYEIHIPDTAYVNVRGKNIENRNIFEKLSGTYDADKIEKELVADNSLKLDATNSAKKLLKITLRFLEKNL